MLTLLLENTEYRSPQSALLARLHPVLLMESPTYALFHAVEEGNLDRVKAAMENGGNADPDDDRNAFQGRDTPLFFENYMNNFSASFSGEH